jgi:hypothetical protein
MSLETRGALVCMHDRWFILAFGLLLTLSIGILVVAAHLPVHAAAPSFS